MKALSGAALLFLGLAACATGTVEGGGSGGVGTTSSTSSTTSDTGTGGASSCAQDCTKITTGTCLMAVCNEGKYAGPIGECVVVPSPAGTTCDDGQFCTVSDTCDGKGQCNGGPQNDCGQNPPECTVVTCDELSKSCGTAPADDGASCTPSDPCKVNGACKSGICMGEAKDCSFSPQAECNTMHCNPTTGACEGTPDTSKNGNACTLTGDLCQTGRTCSAGQCTGGSPKDCSSLTKGCNEGSCNPTNGSCEAHVIPQGGSCTDGIDQCHSGTCDASGSCVASPVTNGTACNDYNPCTTNDACQNGVCTGTTTSGCSLYSANAFETCPGGWKLAGDWQCGVPTSGPSGAHGGTGVVATKLAGDYSSSQDFASCTADSPTIDLTTATAPQLSFYAWIDTEQSSYSATLYDGFNVKISTNNGSTFSQITGVTPAYDAQISSEDAWGGHESALGWQHFTADLTPYAGHQVVLRLAFHSDSSSEFPGVYVDDLIVAEPTAIPIGITTTTLPDAYAGSPYAAALARTGGSPAATWSITGGTNNAWLTIDPATGALSGNPTLAQVGPVSVTVKVQEPSVPGNNATATLSFGVYRTVYTEDFEGACNGNGWTLAGDWQCGSPSSVGPSSAHGGNRCIATIINGDYSNNDTFTGTTATSPDISLAGTAHPKATFWMWINTEGEPFDGANLKVSADGGATYSTITAVTPAYDQTISLEPAWGDDKSALGWQFVQADLAPYVGQTIRLRFAFRSDGSSTYPGVYIDDFFVIDN